MLPSSSTTRTSKNNLSTSAFDPGWQAVPALPTCPPIWNVPFLPRWNPGSLSRISSIAALGHDGSFSFPFFPSFLLSFLPSFLPSFFLSLFHFLPICFDLDSFCLSECISITAGSQLKRAELLLHKLCSNNVAYFDDVMLVQRCQIGSAYLGWDSAGFRRRTVSTSLLTFASCMSSDVVKTLLVALDRKCADAGSLQQSQTVDGDALPDCHSFDIRRSWRQERNLGTIICSTVCRFIWIEFFYFHCRVVKCGPGPADARLYRTEAPAIDGRSAVANTL